MTDSTTKGSMPEARPRLWHRVLGVVAVVATVLVVVSAVGSSQRRAAVAQAVSGPGDGRSSVTAGASCWGIKQQYPGSVDGTYWLVNASLVAPQQFWCDMSTDGGGWVLVGRGREGWSFRPNGQGSASAIWSVPSGTGAFAVAALPTSVIDRLTMGQAMKDYPDGVRVRRAADPAGTAWQEVRYRISGQSTWSWSFSGDMPLASVTVGASTLSGGQRGSRDVDTTGTDGANRIFTQEWNGRTGWLAGWSYGLNQSGAANNATSYLWHSSKLEKHPIPFAQVFLRPRIANGQAGFVPLPAGGTPVSTVRPLLQNRTEWLNEWGVVGRDNRNQAVPDLDAQVLAFAQVGERIFVGGKFSGVQKGKTGTPVAQSFLAAFDRVSGVWIDSFRPNLDGSVWEMVADPNGRLLVAGSFRNVNGVASPGMVALNPQTGAIDASFKASFTIGNTPASSYSVRALSLQGNWLYTGGAFDGVSGGVNGDTRTITQKNLARLDWRTGKPDWQWKASALGPVYEIDASRLGDRVYLSGLFKTVSGVTSPNALGNAVVNTTDGKLVPGLQPIKPSTGSTTAGYGQGILESADGSKVYALPIEHTIQLLDRATLAWQYSHITVQGGDYQALAEIDGVVYGSCHCGNWNYSGPFLWFFPWGQFDRVDAIRYVAGYRSDTLAKDNEFDPQMTSLYGEGPWDFFVDSAKCLWVGGDATSGSWVNGSNMWAGGFVKYCPRDTAAPTTPPNWSATWPAGGVPTLSWAGSTDNSGSVQYEVLRDDRVIATTWGRSFTDTGRTTSARYAVRAVDATGNRSASTPVTSVSPPAQQQTLLPAGSQWSYDVSRVDRGTAWAQPGFDVSGWPKGNGILGFTENDLATTFPQWAQTSYLVRTFTVSDPAKVVSATLDLIRDDGVVVYVNGTEIARDNVPAGAGYGVLAPEFVWGADERAWVSYPVPVASLVAGTNTIAVRLHQATTNPGDASFDGRVRAEVR